MLFWTIGAYLLGFHYYILQKINISLGLKVELKSTKVTYIIILTPKILNHEPRGGRVEPRLENDASRKFRKKFREALLTVLGTGVPICIPCFFVKIWIRHSFLLAHILLNEVLSTVDTCIVTDSRFFVTDSVVNGTILSRVVKSRNH